MRHVADAYQRLKRGGLAARNWFRLECAAGNWEDGVDAATETRSSMVAVDRSTERRGPSLDYCLPVGARNTRCGSPEATRVGAGEVGNRMAMAQELYGAKMRYEKTTRKIEILMNSLSSGARTGYRRSWKQRVCLCRGRNQPVWIDSREERRGETLMKFILSGHYVLGLKASTIRGGISGGRFFYTVSGKNYFTKLGARWEILINGMDMKNKAANRRIPLNTELLEFSRQRPNIDKPTGTKGSIGRGQPRWSALRPY